MPYLSVIIPLYNKEKQIQRTIDSVLNQEFSDFELIIVNDGSTDRSIQIVENIRDNRIRIINQPNSGVSAARNRGMNEAQGKYVFLLDADDRLLQGAFTLLQDEHDEDIILGSFNQTNFEGKVTRYSHNLIQGRVDDPFRADCRKEIFLRIGNMFIKRDFLSNKEKLREDLSLYEDEEWILRLLENATIYSYTQVILNYNREDGGLSFGYKPIEKDWANIASVKNVINKYRKRIIGDFVFKRIIIRLKYKDWHGVRVIWHNNSWHILYCTYAFVSRSLQGGYIKNYIRDHYNR